MSNLEVALKSCKMNAVSFDVESSLCKFISSLKTQKSIVGGYLQVWRKCDAVTSFGIGPLYMKKIFQSCSVLKRY